MDDARETARRGAGVSTIEPGALLKGRYRIERLLGHGGMAAVWLAEDEVLERPVAVKVLSDTIASDPEFLARFRREAHIVAALSHPNLIGVYDYAEAAERPYLVMEYVAGGSLAASAAAGREIDAVDLARQLLGAVVHIHAAGIIHRDIKPQNLLLGDGGEVKLIDFGIALPPDATAITRTGHLIGTARYIAPEVMGGAPATERSDLFSCGVVLRECADEELPVRLRRTAESLCDPDPMRRPLSARAALAAIERSSAEPPQLERRSFRRAAGTAFERPTEQFPLGAPTATGRRESVPGPRRSSLQRLAAVLGIAAVVLAVLLLVVVTGEEGERSPRDGAQAAREGGDSGPRTAVGRSAGEDATASAPTAEVAAVPTPTGADPAAAGALNEEGFVLIQEGRYAEAVPVLEAAVRAFPPGTEDLDYAYALFNLGNALRLNGQPGDAIPVLERRLEIPNQTGTVREELEAARSEAAS